MTAQFHAGQEVEVRSSHKPRQANWLWRKAKIVSPYAIPDGLPRGQLNEQFFVEVQFRDGSRAVVGAEHIREIEPNDEYPGLAEPDDDTSDPMGRIP